MQKRDLVVVYFPGLADHRPVFRALQALAIRIWRFRGVPAYTVWMDWIEDAPFVDKLEEASQAVERFRSNGKSIVLVGSSAGGSAVINAYAKLKDRVAGVVLVSGEVMGRRVGGAVYKLNPKFKQSMEMVPRSLYALTAADRKRILSLYGTDDKIVPNGDSIINGATNLVVGHQGHFLTIARVLTFGLGGIRSFHKGLQADEMVQ